MAFCFSLILFIGIVEEDLREKKYLQKMAITREADGNLCTSEEIACSL